MGIAVVLATAYTHDGVSFSLRPATISDAPAIARVHVDSWRSTYRGIVPDCVLNSLDYESREQIWRDEITDTTRAQFIHVAEVEDGQIIGFVSGGPERTGGHLDYTGEIYALYVRDSWQGYRLGRRLMTTGVRALLDQGHQSMLIWALTENPACGFYRRLGGVPVATQEITAGLRTLEETAFGWKNISSVVDAG